MKRLIHLTILLIFFITLMLLFTLLNVQDTQAQIDAFTFFIPYDTDFLNDAYDAASNEEIASAIGCSEVLGNDIQNESITTTISIAVLRPGTRVYYDHWEDGFEANLTEPTQATTQVWGDSVSANGTLAPTIPPNTSGTDSLDAGTVIVLQSSVLVPRSSSEFFFDGGDKITTEGGSVAVTLAAWPNCADSLFAGAWELYPTSRWGQEYTIPVGENLAASRNGFRTVGLNVQAAQDNTTIEFDLDGNGVFGDVPNVTLNEGQNHTFTSGVVSGAQVRSTSSLNKIQVHLLTGDSDQIPNAYEARAYTILPQDQWTNDYLSARSSDGDYWLYNPNSSDLAVTVSTSIAPPIVITIPANSTLQFATGPTPSPATGVRFTSSGGIFYGVAALDESFRQDWGFALQPIESLTSQALVGWGPVNNLNPPNNTPPPATGQESPVYVTVETTTTLYIDFNNGSSVITRTILPLTEVPITDTLDFDMTGTNLYTLDGTRFIAVWGQDQDANATNPSIDVGTNIVPIRSLAIQKTLEIVDDADGTNTPTWGDTIRFTLVSFNNSNLPLDPTVISDTLSLTLSYVANSSQLNGAAFSDDTTGTTIFPFDEGGISIPGGLAPFSVVSATFEAIIQDNVNIISNTAEVDSPAVPPSDPGTVAVPVNVPRFELNKWLLDPSTGIATSTQIITFGITITSTGNLTITKLPLYDVYDSERLTFLSAEPAPDLSTSGIITWQNLATSTRFGPLSPAQTVSLTLTFQVNTIPESITNTINVALSNGGEGDGGISSPPEEEEEEVRFPTPISSVITATDTAPPPLETATPTVTPTPASPTTDTSETSDDDDDDGDEAPTPTPTPSSNSSDQTQDDPSQPVLPINVLPDTGTSAPVSTAGLQFIILLTSLTILWMIVQICKIRK